MVTPLLRQSFLGRSPETACTAKKDGKQQRAPQHGSALPYISNVYVHYAGQMLHFCLIHSVCLCTHEVCTAHANFLICTAHTELLEYVQHMQNFLSAIGKDILCP